MVVFLGTEAVLDTTDFSPESPGFYVGRLSEYEAPVRKHFSAPQVYHLGAHTGCGCGFEFGQDPEWLAWAVTDPEVAGYDPDPDGPTSRQTLADFLRSLVDAGYPVELHVCWSGDEAEDADHRSRVRPEAVLDPTAVRERHHLVVTDSP